MILQWWFGAQPLNLIPANISGYYIASFVTYFGHRCFWHLTEGGCTHEVVDGPPLKRESAGFVWYHAITLSAPDKNKQQYKCSHKINTET